MFFITASKASSRESTAWFGAFMTPSHETSTASSEAWAFVVVVWTASIASSTSEIIIVLTTSEIMVWISVLMIAATSVIVHSLIASKASSASSMVIIIPTSHMLASEVSITVILTFKATHSSS